MTKEQPPQPTEPFAFTEGEQLYDRISDQRFLSLLADDRSQVHALQVSTNAYGEFLFVTMSYPKEETRQAWTFFGLGFHDYRERWIADTWSWYDTSLDRSPDTIEKDEVFSQLAERRAEITPYLSDTEQSNRGKLYEFLAELTDEDGAISELEDLGDWSDLDEE